MKAFVHQKAKLLYFVTRSKMECKPQKLLLMKSATTLNSIVLIAVICTVVYQQEQLSYLQEKMKISQEDQPARVILHDVQRTSEEEKYHQKQRQKTAQKASLDGLSKSWKSAIVNGEGIRRKRSTDGKAFSDSQRTSSKSKTNTTSICGRCQSECFGGTIKNPGGSKVKQFDF